MHLLKRATSVANRIIRRAASLPLRLIDSDLRAIELQLISDAMIVETILPAGLLRFYAPTPLLRARAHSILNKEPDMIEWINSFSEGTVFWDIGANVGVFSFYATLARKVRAVAFEPSAANFHVLARNIQLNRFSDVSTYCVALSGSTALGLLNLTSQDMGASLSHFGSKGEGSRFMQVNEYYPNHGMIGFTIDDFITRFNPPFPQYIKMDVDGLELAILEGGLNTLADPRVSSVMVELNLTNESETQKAKYVLSSCGLELKSMGDIQVAGNEKAANHLFVRRA